MILSLISMATACVPLTAPRFGPRLIYPGRGRP
jgi:hypothetical protein